MSAASAEWNHWAEGTVWFGVGAAGFWFCNREWGIAPWRCRFVCLGEEMLEWVVVDGGVHLGPIEAGCLARRNCGWRIGHVPAWLLDRGGEASWCGGNVESRQDTSQGWPKVEGEGEAAGGRWWWREGCSCCEATAVVAWNAIAEHGAFVARHRCVELWWARRARGEDERDARRHVWSKGLKTLELSGRICGVRVVRL